MAEIIARFADGRLLVQESRLAESEPTDEGDIPVRIAHVKTVEKVLSIGISSGYTGIVADVGEATASGDVLHSIWRYSLPLSGMPFATSGTPYTVSGVATIKANVIGF